MKRVIAFGYLGEMLACSMSKFHLMAKAQAKPSPEEKIDE